MHHCEKANYISGTTKFSRFGNQLYPHLNFQPPDIDAKFDELHELTVPKSKVEMKFVNPGTECSFKSMSAKSVARAATNNI